MSKVLESLMSDAMNRVKTPEVQAALYTSILSPIFELLYPYLLALIGLWAAMFVCVVVILVCVLRARTIIRVE